MTQIISTQTNTFKFTDEFSSSVSAYYLTTISVKDLKYEDGNHYWDIEYNNIFIPVQLASHRQSTENFKKTAHPFFGSQVEDFMNYQGDIIKKNPMTSIMVEYLLMDYDQLALISGFTTPERYKQRIMWSLANFWD